MRVAPLRLFDLRLWHREIVNWRLDRQEQRLARGREFSVPELPPPCEQQSRIYLMSRGDLTDGRAGFERFADDADLLLSAPLTATLSTRDDLDHPFRHDGSNHTLKLALRCHPWSKPAVRNRRSRPYAYQTADWCREKGNASGGREL